PLLRLGDAKLIEQKVSFPGSGKNATPGLIAMLIDDTVGKDVDRKLDGALVVFNSSPAPIVQKLDGLSGRDFALNAVQAEGTDAVAAAASWESSTGTVTIPARTAVVFVEKH
ncbi:MAG: DUF3372 domain-containing protein, partial [Microbacterium sp.]|nr:DUF3372 domain-containing protein [Microbacterium sp.]